MTKLRRLYHEQGQSPWLDNLQREWLRNGALAFDEYETFSLSYSRKIFENVQGAPTILFTKGGNPWLGPMMQSLSPDSTSSETPRSTCSLP